MPHTCRELPHPNAVRKEARRDRLVITRTLPRILEVLEPQGSRKAVAVVLTGAYVAIYKPPRNRYCPPRLVTPMDIAMAIAHRAPKSSKPHPSSRRPVRPVKIEGLPPCPDCADNVASMLESLRKEAMKSREDLDNLPDTSNLSEVNTFRAVVDIPTEAPHLSSE